MGSVCSPGSSVPWQLNSRMSSASGGHRSPRLSCSWRPVPRQSGGLCSLPRCLLPALLSGWPLHHRVLLPDEVHVRLSLDISEPVSDHTLSLNLIHGIGQWYGHQMALINRYVPFPSFIDVQKELILEEITLDVESTKSVMSLYDVSSSGSPFSSIIRGLLHTLLPPLLLPELLIRFPALRVITDIVRWAWGCPS